MASQINSNLYYPPDGYYRITQTVNNVIQYFTTIREFVFSKPKIGDHDGIFYFKRNSDNTYRIYTGKSYSAGFNFVVSIISDANNYTKIKITDDVSTLPYNKYNFIFYKKNNGFQIRGTSDPKKISLMHLILV